MSTSSLLLVNGPNLSWLGTRSPHIYGTLTLPEIESMVREAIAPSWGLTAIQSDHEGDLVEAIYAHRDCTAAVVNPGALMMYGWSLRDALETLEIPWVEFHISNLWRREPFRHNSIFSGIATAVIAGLGPRGYVTAAMAAIDLVNERLPRTK